MSIDQIAFILENCHHAKFEALPYGMAIKFKLREGEDWQQIEVDYSVYTSLERKHTKIVTQWIVVNEDES